MTRKCTAQRLYAIKEWKREYEIFYLGQITADRDGKGFRFARGMHVPVNARMIAREIGADQVPKNWAPRGPTRKRMSDRFSSLKVGERLMIAVRSSTP